ncbi:hypothetical protein ACEQ8H_002467 [Pleosporales sp. CAS-2024a]
MKLAILALASAYSTTSAVVVSQRQSFRVKGRPEGFGSGTTGGGSAACAIPASVAQLKTWLTDSVARCIVLDREFNFIGSEGTTTETGCRPASNKCPGNGGQDAINNANWCTNGSAGPGATNITVTYDTAGIQGIDLGSNKSLIGVGSAGVLRGKGLRIAHGAQNIIIQNIHITDINPEYIWGGDAITLDGADLVWIDHVKISLIGRQMFVSGYGSAQRVTISNTEFDGRTSWSATCDGHHYWTMLLLGSADLITLKANYLHHTSGRSPKVGGNTLLHAVNNYFANNSGYAFYNCPGGMVVAEGNTFENVVTPLARNDGTFFSVSSSSTTTTTTADTKACLASLGHVCQPNLLINSGGSFSANDTHFLVNFAGHNVASASIASTAPATQAGVGQI